MQAQYTQSLNYTLSLPDGFSLRMEEGIWLFGLIHLHACV